MTNNTILTIATLLFLSQNIFGQAEKMKFGKVDKEEMEMTQYPEDTSAIAVILGEKTYTHFELNQDVQFQFVMTKHVRIKILDKNAYDHANQYIEYYNPTNGDKDESISNIKGMTYNIVDGKIEKSKLTKEGIFDEESNKYWSRKKITLPDVKVGSIIELSYTLTSIYDRFLRDWVYQYDIPVKSSHYNLITPEFYNYKVQQKGYAFLTKNEQTSRMVEYHYNYIHSEPGQPGQGGFTSDRVIGELSSNSSEYIFEANNIPAFIEEPYMTSKEDYISKLIFELQSTQLPNAPFRNYISTWNQVGETYLDQSSFGIQLKETAFANKILSEINLLDQDQLQQANSICDYVKKTMKINKGDSEYSRSLKKAFQEKKGSSGDINLLLIALLQKANIDVSPVVLSTRNNGFIREHFPNSEGFNYVLAYVMIGEEQFLMDATDQLLPNNMIPEKCLNGKGLLIQNGFSRLIPITNSTRKSMSVSASITISDDGSVSGTFNKKCKGYFGRDYRNRILNQGKEKYIEDAIDRSTWELEDFEILDLNKTNNALSINYSGELEDGFNNTGGTLYLSPMFELKESENVFKRETREYPVDFGCSEDKVYLAEFTIPLGYQIAEKPQNALITLPENGAKFQYMVSQNGNKIIVMSKLSINKAMFSQAEYPYLKQFYDNIVAKHAEQIVLKKT